MQAHTDDKPGRDEGVSTLSDSQLDAAGEEALYRSFRRYWHPVAYAHEVADSPLPVTLLGEQLVVVRLDGAPRAFRDLCVHRGTALSLGWVEDDQLRCAYHGWTYRADGKCTSIPARHGTNIPNRAKLEAFPTVERHGLVWVSLVDEPVFPIPAFPQHDDPAFRAITLPTYDWHCGAARRLENFVDFAHFAWVHDGVLGSREQPEVPDHPVWRENHVLRFEAEGFKAPGDTDQNWTLSTAEADIEAAMSYHLFMPLTICASQNFADGKRYVLFMSASPLGPRRTRSFTLNARNYSLSPDEDQAIIEFEQSIIEADRPITESQRPEELPVDLSAELHIRGADRVSIEYRKWLIELATRA